MKKFVNLVALVSVISALFICNIIPIDALAINPDAEYVILTEELYESSIAGNEDIVPIPYDICSIQSSNISLFSNDEMGVCYHPAFYNPSTGECYYFTKTHYIIDVTTPNGNIVKVNEHTSEFPDWYIENVASYADNMGITATKTDEPTIYYNCHSYAWHWNDSDNVYWMNDPSMYYSNLDKSYVEVQYPREGDIVCYYGTDGNSSDIINLHSGVIVNVLTECSTALSSIMVESKWGPLGRYVHRGDECPYVSNYGGNTDYVKFYRPRTNMEIDLNANMSLRNSSISLSNTGEITDRYYMYELNVEASGIYAIYVNPDISLNERFYNENMNLLSYSAYYPNSTFSHHYYANLAQGRYYFRVENVNASESTDARITFLSHDFHNYQYTNINDNNHTASCTCGHTEISDHAYEYKQISDFYHILKCDCGATSGIQEGHIYTGSGLIGYVKCIQCGFLKYVGNTTIPIIKGKIPTIEAICKE